VRRQTQEDGREGTGVHVNAEVQEATLGDVAMASGKVGPWKLQAQHE
jgi:hypothetical protein